MSLNYNTLSMIANNNYEINKPRYLASYFLLFRFSNDKIPINLLSVNKGIR